MQHSQTAATTSPPPFATPSAPPPLDDRAQALETQSALVGRLLNKTKEQGAQVLRLGRALVFIDDHQLFKEAADEHGDKDQDIYAWVDRVHGLKRDQANKYL